MSYSVLASGPYTLTGINEVTSYATYSFFSNLLTTTDSFEDNILSFGKSLSELWIVNTGSNPIAFQFPEFYITQTAQPVPANTASGVVLGNDKIYFRQLRKRGMKIRSANTGSQSTFYVFGV